MLMGEYAHTLDAKGRITLPVDFKEELGESFCITKGLEGCLFIYSLEGWDSLSEKLRKLPLAKPEARALSRFFFSGARKLECDRQGRFLVPGTLRSHAKLQKDAVFIGVSTRVELWDKDTWERYNSEINPMVTQLAENLADLGL